MEELQRAIENITRFGEKFPKEEFEVICANRDAAIPYLRGAVEKAIREKEDIEEGYELHFYAIYLLAQFQDRAFFPKLMELATLPDDTLDFLIGDAITENLRDILYNTYNGDLNLIKQAVFGERVDDFAKASMIDVMGQLYLDQTLGKQEWQDFLRSIIYEEEEIGDYLYAAVAEMICKCHFTEMLPDIWKLYQDGRIDELAIGRYDECVDRMFDYREEDKRFCKPSLDAAKALSGWAMFREPEEHKPSKQEIAKLQNGIRREMLEAEKRERVKIGRNDPCPCGSGKKYKQCCLNKPQNAVPLVESEQARMRWLRRYPPAKTKENENRVYLEDLYSTESIEFDKLLYLALRQREIPIWMKESEDVERQRKRAYLTEAFHRFVKIVEEEKIGDFAEYDSRYAIHYSCDQWMGELWELLEERDEEGIRDDVRETYKKMKKG